MVLQKTLCMVLAQHSFLHLGQATVIIQAFAQGLCPVPLLRGEPRRAGGAWVPSGGASAATVLSLPPQLVWHHKAVVILVAVPIEH